MKAVVLFSGGLDSTALLLARDPEDAIPLFVNYGQPHLAMEQGAAEAIAQRHGYTLRRMTIREAHGAFLMRPGNHVVANRNAILLSVAVGVAAREDACRVLIGCAASDQEGFSDCRPKFIRAYNALLEAQGVEIEVNAPLMMSSKEDIAALIRHRGGDPGATWSCYFPKGPDPCGVCPACVARAGVDA